QPRGPGLRGARVDSGVTQAIAKRAELLQSLRRKGQFEHPLARAARNLAYPITKDKLGYDDAASRVLSTDDALMRATFVITYLDQDRDGDVVMPEGIHL